MRASAAARLAPDIQAHLWAAADPDDRGFLARIYSGMPETFARKLVGEYEARHAAGGRRDANLYALSLRDEIMPEMYPGKGLSFTASDDEIAEHAERAAAHVRERLRVDATEAENLAALARIAERYCVRTADCKTFAGIVARMRDTRWWRRALRKRFQIVEHCAVRAGLVHRRAAEYVSDEAMHRHERHARKIARLLDAMEAVNLTTGETLPLADLGARGVSIPTFRRKVMMLYLRGLEEFAGERGHVARFITLTCPSRMHARHFQSGDANPRYDGTSPGKAHGHLMRLWNNALRKTKHAGIECFGLRVVEPHHDETPHVHVLAFVEAARADEFVAVLRAHAMREDSAEPGAELHRFKVEDIDPAKGSAVGYVAKYVSKSTDGHGLEADGDEKASASRVVVWARVWRIRQFQFFGVPPITAFRELYRLDALPLALEAELEASWQASKGKDFGAYVRAAAALKEPLALLYEDRESQRYPGEVGRKLVGIIAQGDAGPVTVVTRRDDWQVRERSTPKGDAQHWPEAVKQGVFRLPWTRINNSAPIDLAEIFIARHLFGDEPQYDAGGIGLHRPYGEANQSDLVVFRTSGYPIGKPDVWATERAQAERSLRQAGAFIEDPAREIAEAMHANKVQADRDRERVNAGKCASGRAAAPGPEARAWVEACVEQ